MNRREFLTNLLKGTVGAVAAAKVDIDKLLSATSHLTDDEFKQYDFVTYITMSFNFMVVNPAMCARIDGIEE